MIRFCDDCLQERTDTTWSDHFSARLCADCFNLRCEVIKRFGPSPEYRDLLDASDMRDL